MHDLILRDIVAGENTDENDDDTGEFPFPAFQNGRHSMYYDDEADSVQVTIHDVMRMVQEWTVVEEPELSDAESDKDH